MLTISCLEGEVILGVDTHLDTHAAVLIDPLGRLVAAEAFATTRRGLRALIAWANSAARSARPAWRAPAASAPA